MFADLLICLRFFSRLPVPVTAREAAFGSRGLAEAAAMTPVAGAILGLITTAIFLAVCGARFPTSVAAVIAIAAAVALAGALHEDGLADCADGFGGGRTRDRKLDIMRDSRLGTFGSAALALSLYIRIAALTAASTPLATVGAAALVAAGALSRTACLLPLVLLPPARDSGAGAAAARPAVRTVAIAGLLSVGLSSVAVWTADLSIGVAALAPCTAFAAAFLVSALAQRQIGGQTGDVAGAAQQMAEIGVLIVFAANWR